VTDYNQRHDRDGAVTALLSLITIVAWGVWIPVAQAVPGVPQRSRSCYVTIGNAVFAAVVLAVAGGPVTFGWRTFWLPLAGGLIWTAGNYSAFRAAEAIGIARAAGSWAPLNIIVAFAWGAALFGELTAFSAGRFAVLGAALVLVLAGMLLIVRSQDAESGAAQPAGERNAGGRRRGLLWAGAAGVLWGSYFVPAQWAGVSAQAGNFPLAIGILIGGLALAFSAAGEPVRLPPRATVTLLAAGGLFGVGNLALLGLVARVGTGTGFTIAQLSLLVNASIGIWIFKAPKPGSAAARLVIAGIVIAGAGGTVIGVLR
jgi:glucose uptake protein